MSPGGFIVALAMLIIVVWWIGAPLFRRGSPELADALVQDKRERLLAYYERVLTNIRDLDEDHATGKMRTAEYGIERGAWVQRGIQVLKALDSIAVPSAPEAHEAAFEGTIDDEIEAAVAAYRSKTASSEPE